MFLVRTVRIGDPATNLAYPGRGCRVLGGPVPIPPGAVLTLDGTYPHARYMSLTSYGLVDGVEHPQSMSCRTLRSSRITTSQSLPPRSRAIRPDRDYQVTIQAAGETVDARNILKVPPTSAGAVQELIYRMWSAP